MRRLFVRRSATAAGIYVSVVIGFFATVLAARLLPTKEAFGLFSIVFAATSFCQSLFDLTVEEAVVKYGFRYIARENWGRLRELFRRALLVKLAGSLVGGIALLVLAPFADSIFGTDQLEVPMLLAAGIPLGQSLE